jgi:hypothetical protein
MSDDIDAALADIGLQPTDMDPGVYELLGGTTRSADIDMGARKGATLGHQLRRSDLRRMTPEQIANARKSGQLAEILSGNPHYTKA